MPTPLSPAAQSLLDDMRKGVRVLGMFGFNAYYFRADNFKWCTRQVDALLRRGLAVEVDRDWRGSKVVPAPPTPTQEPTP